MCLVLAVLHTRPLPHASSVVTYLLLVKLGIWNPLLEEWCIGPYFLILCIFERVFLLTLKVNKLASFTFLWSPLKQIYLYLGFRDVSSKS